MSGTETIILTFRPKILEALCVYFPEMFKVLNEHLKTVKTAQVFPALNNQANFGNNSAWSGPRECSN